MRLLGDVCTLVSSTSAAARVSCLPHGGAQAGMMNAMGMVGFFMTGGNVSSGVTSPRPGSRRGQECGAEPPETPAPNSPEHHASRQLPGTN